MRYMLLIYNDEQADPAAIAPDLGDVFSAYGAFTEEVNVNGVFVAGDPLSPVATATSVRVRNGKTTLTDGPFAETKEQLGGYYILNCKDLDEALGYAAKVPGAKYGTIEVRPVMDMG